MLTWILLIERINKMSLLFGYSSGLSTIEEGLDMQGNRIINLPNPVTGSEPVSKEYADKHYSGGSSSKGPKGDRCLTGAQGPRGLPGSDGSQGPCGLPGAQGARGPKGDTRSRGPRGLPGSGGLSASGFTMQGNIDMGNNKTENVADPVLANDPITKQYANRVYLTHSGFTMQDNIGMNNHEVLGLNPTPSHGSAAVSKDYTESRYVVKDADIDMNNNRILNLPFPQSLAEPVTKAYANMHYYDYLNILTFEGTPNTHTVTHIDDMVDTPFNGRSNNILDFSKVGDSYQINFNVTPKLPAGIYAYEMDIVLTTSRGYNILWGDCSGSGYNASTKYKYWSWSLENKIAQNDAQGGYFHRATGKNTH